MAMPLRLCWEQLDSVWMNWLLKSQLHPEMPVKTCPPCAQLLQPFSFQKLFPSASRPEGFDPVCTQAGRRWLFSGVCPGLALLCLREARDMHRAAHSWIICYGYLMQQSMSQPHTYWRDKNIQQSPSLHESIGLLEAGSCSPEIALLLISSLNSPEAVRVMDAQPDRCLIHMFFNNWMIKYSVIPGTAAPGL